MNQPYNSYKNSGIDWLSMIPTHWEVLPLKRIARMINRGTSPDYVEESGIPVINQACIYWTGINLNKIKLTKEIDLADYKAAILKGDLLINSTGTGTLGRAAVFTLEGEYIADSHVTIIRFESRALAQYYFYLIQSDIYQNYIYSELAVGSTNQIELSREGLRNTPVVLPSFIEQTAIATYLDRKTSQIDTLLAKKEHLLSLLQDKRQAIINEAVTCSLDANKPRKDSGIEWLGDIPAHWETKKLKWITNSITDGAHISPDTTSEDYPFVSTVDIKRGKIEFENCLRTTSESYIYLVRTGCQPKVGDVLFSKDGTIGRTAVIDFEKDFVVASSLIILTPNRSVITTSYLEIALQSLAITNQVESLISGSALRRISILKVSNLTIAVPPIEEQLEIINALHQRLAKIDSCLDVTILQIQKLKSYRQSIISEVVTGKVDVRGVALKTVLTGHQFN